MNKATDTENHMPKPYMSIGEVAEMFGISVAVLRKWETDFPRVLRPKRTLGDTRLYNSKQVEKVAMIHRLLHIEKMTVQGAQKRLREKQSSEEQKQTVITKLKQLRQELLNIVNELDLIKPLNEERHEY